MGKLWKQITPSDYSWEQEALDFLGAELAYFMPFSVWANVEPNKRNSAQMLRSCP